MKFLIVMVGFTLRVMSEDNVANAGCSAAVERLGIVAPAAATAVAEQSRFGVAVFSGNEWKRLEDVQHLAAAA